MTSNDRNDQPNEKRRSFRRLNKWTRLIFESAHRWLGLTVGLHFVLLGLSGSYLVVSDSLDRLRLSSLYKSADEAPTPSWANSVSLAQGAIKTDLLPQRIILPKEDDSNTILRFDLDKSGKSRDPVHVFVDPTATNFVGATHDYKTLTGFLFFFHHDFLLGKTGRTIMAFSAILILVILFAGIYLWWPRSRSVASGFKMRKARSPLQFNLELHKLFGIYSVALLILSAGTGLYNSKSEWFIDKKSEPPTEVAAYKPDFAAIEKKASEIGFSGRPFVVRIDAKKARLTISKMRTEESATFNLATGELLKTQKAFSEPRDVVNRRLHDIHFGDYWGFIGHVIVFLVGLLPAFFYITGFIVWSKKRAAQRTLRLKASL